MANFVALVGFSGTGKSTSFGQFPQLKIKGLDPKETYVINVSTKPLPFKGWKKIYSTENKNYLETSDCQKIADIIKGISDKATHIKHIVIDDAQYIMSFEFMRRAKEAGYGKFADIGVNINKVIDAARAARPDLTIIFNWHPEGSKEAGFKMKTVGKMVDDYLTLEGLFTTILYTKVEKEGDTVTYHFVTNNDGQYPAKSPVGMFDELYINNDMGFVIDKINEYYAG
jgi:hypothetical protein